jgi:hypothetical protein
MKYASDFDTSIVLQGNQTNPAMPEQYVGKSWQEENYSGEGAEGSLPYSGRALRLVVEEDDYHQVNKI